MESVMQGSPSTSSSAAAPSGLLRAIEVAHHLRIGVRTVWKLKATGKLPAVNILGTTRFRSEDVARLARDGVQ
jgi:hypothetical protein